MPLEELQLGNSGTDRKTSNAHIHMFKFVMSFTCFSVPYRSDPKRLADTLQNENEESCTTYNMLKVFTDNIHST